MPEGVGEVLRAARERRKLTVEALAQAAKVSPARLAMYERGEAMPSLLSAARVAAALGITLKALNGGAG